MLTDIQPPDPVSRIWQQTSLCLEVQKSLNAAKKVERQGGRQSAGVNRPRFLQISPKQHLLPLLVLLIEGFPSLLLRHFLSTQFKIDATDCSAPLASDITGNFHLRQSGPEGR